MNSKKLLLSCIAAALGVAGSHRVHAQSEWMSSSLRPHETSWVRQDSNGNVISSFVEIASGLNRQLENGSWVRSSDDVELFERGAIVRGAQYQAIFTADSDNPDGTFDISLPGGAGRIRGQCVGLVFTDASGDSVFIGEMRNVQGSLIGRNLIVYEDCFTGIKADLQYHVTIGGVAQDIVLHESVRPQDYGLDPATTRLEVWTQFLETPEPQKQMIQARTLSGKPSTDCLLNFGPMQIGAGKAHSVEVGHARYGDYAPVHKEFETIDSMIYLIEKIQIEDAPAFSALPQKEHTQVDRKTLKQKMQARVEGKQRAKPVSLASMEPKRPKSGAKGEMRRLAMLDKNSAKGYLLDFDLTSSYTNMTFRSDTTYYASGTVALSGTSTFEGSTVVKFAPTNSSQLTIMLGGTVSFPTNLYRPVTFCARDDHSAGIALTTNALSGYYAECALNFTPTNGATFAKIANVRISDAKRALYINGSSGGAYNELKHAQVVHCREGVKLDAALLTARNVLFYGLPSDPADTNSITTNFVLNASAALCEHLTVNNSSLLFKTLSGSPTLTVTNSVFVAVTNFGSTFASVSNYTNASGSGVFREVGGGKCYLVDGSSLRNAGSTSIDSGLAADLKLRTVFAPILWTNLISSDTTWLPQVKRDIDEPDLGFHYYPLDYIADIVIVTNCTLTIKGGAQIATYPSYGLFIEDGAKLECEGLPNKMNRFVENTMVQEQPLKLGNPTYSAVTIFPYKYTNILANSINVRFTDFLCWSRYHLREGTDFQADTLSVRDSSFNNGTNYFSTTKNGSATIGFTNNLFERVSFTFVATNTVAFYNNLHVEGAAILVSSAANKFTFRDNAYDHFTFTLKSGTMIIETNAFIASTNVPTGTGNIVLSSFTYTNGPLGNYYHFSTNLSNVGGRTADTATLYHYTTPYSLAKETNSVVDVGYHYVATDSSGVPLDYDADGSPDYMEDRNGDGGSTGETDWQTYNSTSSLAGPSDLRTYTPLK